VVDRACPRGTGWMSARRAACPRVTAAEKEADGGEHPLVTGRRKHRRISARIAGNGPGCSVCTGCGKPVAPPAAPPSSRRPVVGPRRGAVGLQPPAGQHDDLVGIASIGRGADA